jgi:hypothetical protein
MTLRKERSSSNIYRKLFTFFIIVGPIIDIIYHYSGRVSIFYSQLSLAQFLRGIMSVIMLLFLIYKKNLSIFNLSLIRPIILLILYVMLTSFIHKNFVMDILFSFRLFFLILIFASAYYLSYWRMCNENWLLNCALWISLIVFTSQIIGLKLGKTVGAYNSSFATAGLLDQPSIAALTISSVIPIYISYILKRKFAIFGITVTLVSLFLTMRRTELIATMIALLIYIFFVMSGKYVKHIRALNIAIMIFVLFVLALVWIKSPAGQDLIIRFNELNPKVGTGSGRYIFWMIVIKNMLNRSIIKNIIGEGQERIRDLLSLEFGVPIGSHSAFLEVTFAFGIIGIVFIAWWYYNLIKLCNYFYKDNSSIFLGLLSVIIIMFVINLGQGSFDDPSFALIYCSIGYWVGKRNYYKKEGKYGKNSINRALQF